MAGIVLDAGPKAWQQSCMGLADRARAAEPESKYGALSTPASVLIANYEVQEYAHLLFVCAKCRLDWTSNTYHVGILERPMCS
eukprot:1139983-Pelagomonas_calceolata.AAC.2